MAHVDVTAPANVENWYDLRLPGSLPGTDERDRIHLAQPATLHVRPKPWSKEATLLAKPIVLPLPLEEKKTDETPRRVPRLPEA